MNEQETRKLVVEMVSQEMYAFARQAADKSVEDALQKIGIDPLKPMEAQKRAQTLATITLLIERGGIAAWTTLIALFVTGGALALWRIVEGN